MWHKKDCNVKPDPWVTHKVFKFQKSKFQIPISKVKNLKIKIPT